MFVPSFIGLSMVQTGSPPTAGWLGNSDFDRFRLSFLALGEVNFQHAVLELGVDFRRVSIVRQRKAAGETAVGPLEAMILLVLFLLLELAFAREGQHPALD